MQMANDGVQSVGNVGNTGNQPAGKTGNEGGRLPADINERKFLDTLDKDTGEDNNEGGEDEVDDNADSNESDNDEGDDNADEGNQEGDETENEDEEEENNEQDEEEEDDEPELALDDQDEDSSIYKRLKKLNKNIFKEVPGLRNVIFREQEYTKRFPTIEDAEQASELASTFVQFQEDIEKGDAATFVEAIGKLGDETLTEFSGNYLPSLLKQNREVYLQVIAPEIKRMLRAVAASGNKDLIASAENVNYFLFKNTDLNKDEGFKQGEKKTDDRVSQKEKEFENRQFKSFAQDTMGTGQKRLTKIIHNTIKDFGLSQWSTAKIVDDINKRVLEGISKDTRYTGQMDSLLRRAKSNGFTAEDKDRLINTFLSRAKAAIPKYRAQVLQEAKVSKKQEGKDGKKPIRISGNAQSSSGRIQGKVDPKRIDWNKTTERDLLNGKVTYKKD